VVFPPAFRFLVGYSNSYLTSLPTATEYLSLSLRLLLAFGVIFEMPIFMVLLARLGVVTTAGLRRHRRYAILINFIVAAILTPTPDVVNQCLMAIPLMILYEVSVIAVRMFGSKGAGKKAGKADGKSDDAGGAGVPLLTMDAGNRGQKTEDRGQKTEDRGQETGGEGQP